MAAVPRRSGAEWKSSARGERQSQGPRVEDGTTCSVPPSMVRPPGVQEPDWGQISAQAIKHFWACTADASTTRCLWVVSTLSAGVCKWKLQGYLAGMLDAGFPC